MFAYMVFKRMKYLLIVSSNCFESVEAENSCKHCRQNPAQCTHFLQGKIRTQEISSRHKNNKSSPFEAASVPHTRVELVIYCVRGSCPGPLDECGIIRRFLFRNRVQKYNFFSIWQTFCNIFLTSQLLLVILQHIAIHK